MEIPYIWYMKTTLNVRDDLFRRAKAQAALMGISLGRFLEESLELMLQDNSKEQGYWVKWAQALPGVSREAAKSLDEVFSDKDFRKIDKEMWS